MSRKMAKLISLVVACLMLGLLLVGCGASNGGATQAATQEQSQAQAPAKQPVEVEFWTFSDYGTGDALNEFNSYISEFEAANPGITIKFVTKPDTDILSGILTGASSGVLPDAFTIALNSAYDITKTGVVQDITTQWNAESADYKAQFAKTAVSALSVDGKVWGIPITAYTTILYRNLTVLKQAGIDPSAGIKDWADWLAQMKTVTDSKAVAIADHTTDGWGVDSFLGGVPGVQVDVQNNQTTITADQFATCFKFMKDVSKYASKVSYGDQTVVDMFIANKLAFYIMGPWGDPNFAKAKQAGTLDYDYIPIPGQNASMTGGVRGGEWLGITNGKKTDAAYKWINFLADKKQMTRFASKLGRLLFNDQAMADPSVASNALIKCCAQALAGGINDAAYFKLFPTDTRKPIADNASTVVKGTKTPEQAGKDAVAGVNQVIAQSN
jgi:multiple sugar transport system substrate-binding protein